ncbi:MAG: twin-arginine translocation signal domain-containing protein, partial [Planctomycetota bacterium]
MVPSKECISISRKGIPLMFEDMSRRNFIKTSAAIGAGIYVSGKALGADAPQKDVIN